jgi:hypothetical protein
MYWHKGQVVLNSHGLELMKHQAACVGLIFGVEMFFSKGSGNEICFVLFLNFK